MFISSSSSSSGVCFADQFAYLVSFHRTVFQQRCGAIMMARRQQQQQQSEFSAITPGHLKIENSTAQFVPCFILAWLLLLTMPMRRPLCDKYHHYSNEYILRIIVVYLKFGPLCCCCAILRAISSAIPPLVLCDILSVPLAHTLFVPANRYTQQRTERQTLQQPCTTAIAQSTNTNLVRTLQIWWPGRRCRQNNIRNNIYFIDFLL